jgi:hypothetical protein
VGVQGAGAGPPANKMAHLRLYVHLQVGYPRILELFEVVVRWRVPVRL